MLTSYPGIIENGENGQIRLQEPADLPDGTEVLIVVASPEN